MGKLLKTFIICLQFFFLPLFEKPGFPASISVIRTMSFGEIIASPSGDVIVIDARFGTDEEPAVLSRSSAIVKGGHSGIIRVVSDTAGQTINITYPPSISLKADGYPDMVIDGIGFRSKALAVSIIDGEVIDFGIGGLLHIVNVQGNAFYSETITIDVDIINP